MTNTDCNDLIDSLHAEARDQVALALLAKAEVVVGMHLDLAEFSEQQARVADEICQDV